MNEHNRDDFVPPHHVAPFIEVVTHCGQQGTITEREHKLIGTAMTAGWGKAYIQIVPGQPKLL